MALTGNEIVLCIPVLSNGQPSGVQEAVTTQAIANLGGGGGGGTETGQVISAGGTYTVHTPAAGSPKNVIVTTTSAVTINIDAPNAGTPWGRVNITDNSGNPNVTVTPASGLINGAASASVLTAYGSDSLIDFGTGWGIQ